MISTRPDIAVIVNLLGRRVEDLSEKNLKAAQRVLQFLWQTTCEAHILNAPVEIAPEIHVDASYEGEGSRSQTGVIIQIGGQTIHWYTRRQDVAALSVTEAEYIAASEGGKDAAWIRQLMELGETITPTIRIDNEAADKLTNTSAFHRRTRRIEHRFHYIREDIEKGT
jgi:hypothetical protein